MRDSTKRFRAGTRSAHWVFPNGTVITKDVYLHAKLVAGVSTHHVLDDKASTWMHILPFVESKDMAAKNHERIACSYAGFDLPRGEGAEARHSEWRRKMMETQVEGALMVKVVQVCIAPSTVPALVRVRTCFAYRIRQQIVHPLAATQSFIREQPLACSHLFIGIIYCMLNRYSRLLGAAWVLDVPKTTAS